MLWGFVNPLFPFRAVPSSLDNGRQTDKGRKGRRGKRTTTTELDWIGSGTRWEGLGGAVARVLFLSPGTTADRDGNRWHGVGSCTVVCAESQKCLFSRDV